MTKNQKLAFRVLKEIGLLTIFLRDAHVGEFKFPFKGCSNFSSFIDGALCWCETDGHELMYERLHSLTYRKPYLDILSEPSLLIALRQTIEEETYEL